MRQRRQYWWLVAADPETGQPYLVFGSDRSEAEARQKGLDMMPGVNFDIRMFRTRNLDMARSLLRGSRLDGQRSLREAGRRQGHEKSVSRLIRRNRRRRFG